MQYRWMARFGARICRGWRRRRREGVRKRRPCGDAGALPPIGRDEPAPGAVSAVRARTPPQEFSPRMTHSGCATDVFPDGHLAQIAHAGFDAILFNISGPDQTRASSGKTDVNSIIDAAAAWGLDSYMYSQVKATRNLRIVLRRLARREVEEKEEEITYFSLICTSYAPFAIFARERTVLSKAFCHCTCRSANCEDCEDWASVP